MLKKIAFFMFVWCSCISFAVAQSQDKESNLKAAFIYNFTKYIDWENNDADNNFIIGILGTSEIDEPINSIARTSFIKNKRIIVKRFSKVEDIGYCHILFVPGNSRIPIQSVLEKVEKVDKGVLIISEEPGLARLGSGINFVRNNDKLKFEININALNSAGLKASSQLLKLAIIVD
jgi:YfiR/HmsC-like